MDLNLFIFSARASRNPNAKAFNWLTRNSQKGEKTLLLFIGVWGGLMTKMLAHRQILLEQTVIQEFYNYV